MVSKTESDLLINGKKKQGKCTEEAYREVEVLNNSQKTFKKVKSELDKAYKTINNQDEQIKNLKEKIFKMDFEKRKQESNEVEDDSKCTLMKLRRIIRFMIIDKEYSKNELAKELVINTKDIKDYVKFLNDSKITKIEIKGDKLIRKKI